MKRLTALILILSSLFLLTSCGGKEASSASYEIALITDSSGLKDRESANTAVWNGIVRAAAENKKSYKQYTAERDTGKYYRRITAQAVENSAKIIILVGDAFSDVIKDLQKKYPDVYFLWIDGTPLDEIHGNTCIVTYNEEQLGFFAGYAAVKDGFKKIGFMGGGETASTNKYCGGFLLGADKAAQELKLNKNEVTVRCYYSDEAHASPETAQKAADWYTHGTELIFTCGGNIYDSVINAAEMQKNKFVITDGTDRINASSAVISSSVKKMSDTAYNYLNSYCKNEFFGGKVVVKDFSSGEIEISKNYSKWRTFAAKDYAMSTRYMNTGMYIPDNITQLPLNLVQFKIEK